MVNFQCEGCVQVLKKKQVEPHFYQCRNSQYFSCLTCFKVFDRDSVKQHTDCITEQEKYFKGDNVGKKSGNGLPSNNNKVVVPVDLNELKWSGFRKTSKKILMGSENFKLAMTELFDKLAHVYAKNKSADKEDVDLLLVKKHIMSKFENDDRYVLDLSKHTIRYKA